MNVELEPGLVPSLREEVGEDRRLVAEYDRAGYDVVYSRGAVEKRVRKHADDVHTELVFKGIGGDHFEALFDAGDLHCFMHRFDEINAFHFADAEYTGLCVSIDSGARVDLNDFSNTVRDHLK